MKKNIPKLLAILFILTMIIVLALDFKNSFYPQKTVGEYYTDLRNQENILSGEKISDEQNQTLLNCGKDFRCFVEFYEQYNASTTLEKTFSNLSLLLKTQPQYTDYCHQMTHGIGHSELDKDNGDLQKALSDFDAGKFFKNISTCGSGYFHGLIEESVKEIKDKDELVTFFKSTCDSEEIKKVAESDCIHGLGHATFIQTDYNIENSLYVCNKVTDSVYNKFNCYTGVFMEANLDLPQNDLILKETLSGKDNFKFPMCDALSDELQRRACFFESVLQFKNFVGNNQDSRKDYVEMIKYCKIFNNDLYRLICVKNIALRSISETSLKDIQTMCIQNTSTRAERIFCVTGFSHRMALSLFPKDSPEYFEVANDLCKNLNYSEASVCRNIIKNQKPRTYIVEDNDLKI